MTTLVRGNSRSVNLLAHLTLLLGWEKLPNSSRSALTPSDLAALSEFPPDWPEIEYITTSGVVGPSPGPGQYVSINIALVAPLSRGNVTITSNDTSINPVISPNWLVNETDQHVAVQAFKRARQIASATGVAVREVAPGVEVQSDEDILAWIRNTTVPVHHASASCKSAFVGRYRYPMRAAS